jgi:hypothetical protein
VQGDEDSAFFEMVRVQWWVPMTKGKKLDEWRPFEDYWNGKWKCNFVDPK